METVSFRLEKDQAKSIEKISKELKIDKSSVARRIIDIGLKEYKKQEALNNVRTKKWTVWKAASYCCMSYRSFLKILRENNVPFPLSPEEFQRELNEGSSE